MDIVEAARFAAAWVCSRLGLGDDRGATAVEYGIMVALIAVVIIIAVRALGTQIKSAFCAVVSAIGGSCP